MMGSVQDGYSFSQRVKPWLTELEFKWLASSDRYLLLRAGTIWTQLSRHDARDSYRVLAVSKNGFRGAGSWFDGYRPTIDMLTKSLNEAMVRLFSAVSNQTCRRKYRLMWKRKKRTLTPRGV